MPYNISEERRDWYRRVSARARSRKLAATNGDLARGEVRANTPSLDPATLMPPTAPHGLRALSLFSGGGGMDIGFERAGFEHRSSGDLFDQAPNCTDGARSALGLPDIGFDCCAPTIRSGFTGPRFSTSILNSKASQRIWEQLRIWPNGVQRSREEAAVFPPENGHFRLAVQDGAVLQGFPDEWQFSGAAYQVIGQIGNAVCPPVAYAVAKSVAAALGAKADEPPGSISGQTA